MNYKIRGDIMKAEARGKFLKVNDSIVSVEDEDIFEKIQKPSIYEVIRVMGGVPIFLEEHLDRMFKSASIIDYEMPYTKDEIKESIREVLIENEITDQNIKLLGSEVDNEAVFLVYFVDSFYPPKEYYDNGIVTILYDYQRDNPHAKVQKDEFRSNVKVAIDEKGAFEALLVNDEGYIPEGSRSNMFFVKDNKIFTAPSDQVLLGITRKYIFNLAEVLDIEIIEESIHRDEIKELQGAFMSGTSVGVLPIRSIDSYIIESTDNEVIKKLNKSYDELIENFIKGNKSYWE